jgi:uncharacterized protein
MEQTMAESPTPSSDGATVVITHRIKPDKHREYEQWLDEIAPFSKSSAGNLDWHVVRPIRGITDTYTVILRFDTDENLKKWMGSEARARLISRAKPLFAGGDDFYVRSGLDFWFTPQGAQARIPVRWKQYLLTWSAIYPLALVVPLAIAPVLRGLGIEGNRPLSVLLFTALMVFLMVYGVMPRYTRLVHKWLFK